MRTAQLGSRTGRPALFALVAVGVTVLGITLWATTRGGAENVFASLGGGPRPLTPGALNVDDIASEPSGYKGPLTLRAVVAKTEGSNPSKFVVVDAREAKICKSTNCAKFYLPVSAEAAMPVSRWDEIDIEGELVQVGHRLSFKAASLKNLGQFK